MWCDSSREKFTTKDVHVLVVDDNYMNIRVVEGLLASYNIKVSIAASGKEALEKIEEAEYDFVFMDHMMPEMDGVETMHRIRLKDGIYYKNVPIIALTAAAVVGTRELLLAEGFNDFLEKPIERSDLERVMKHNLDRGKIVIGEENALLEQLTTEGLDVDKGILYCGGVEQYLKAMRRYCEDWTASAVKLQKLFDRCDWINYTIEVHAVKSAMRGIGATGISEKARMLELAGKEARVEYILTNHREMMRAYRELFITLGNNRVLCPAVREVERNQQIQNVQESGQEHLVLSESDFAGALERLEEAAYDLDADTMHQILEELQDTFYCEKALRDSVLQAKRKVEALDFLSAKELLAMAKDKLSV